MPPGTERDKAPVGTVLAPQPPAASPGEEEQQELSTSSSLPRPAFALLPLAPLHKCKCSSTAAFVGCAGGQHLGQRPVLHK